MIIWHHAFRDDQFLGEWSFFPTPASSVIWLFLQLSEVVTVQWWTLCIVIVALVQGPLTLALHCSELIASVIRDERYWRRATRRKGLRMKITRLNSLFTDPFSLVLFAAKPILRESFALLCINALSDDLDWMFGLSCNSIASIEGNTVLGIEVVMYPAQVRI